MKVNYCTFNTHLSSHHRRKVPDVTDYSPGRHHGDDVGNHGKLRTEKEDFENIISFDFPNKYIF